MSRQYHYLVAGFPDLLFDDAKLSISLDELRKTLNESLHPDDMEIIRLFFYRYDNDNILERLKDPESSLDQNGNLSDNEINALISSVKEGSFESEFSFIPSYLGRFIEAYIEDSPIREDLSWDLQLSELYFNYACCHSNKFISEWFSYERDLMNIITASQCRKYEIPVESQLVGKGDLIDKLCRSNSRDFGIGNEFPFLDQVIKTTEEEDLKEFEKKSDRIKWDYLDEEVFFHYFTIEKLFSFIIKLSIVERWLALDKETGQRLFNELLSNMEATYEFPEEFKLKK